MMRLFSVTNIMQALHSVTNISAAECGRGCWVMVVRAKGKRSRVAEVLNRIQEEEMTHFRTSVEIFLHLAFNPYKCRTITHGTTEGGTPRCHGFSKF
jgi:hypothetical protein